MLQFYIPEVEGVEQVIDDDDVEKEANSTWAGIIYGQISIYLVVYAKNLRVEEQPNLPFFSEK